MSASVSFIHRPTLAMSDGQGSECGGSSLTKDVNDEPEVSSDVVQEEVEPVVCFPESAGDQVVVPVTDYIEVIAALHNSINEGDWDVVQYLVSWGANVNIPDSSGNAALHLAIKGGNWDMAKYLVSMGADANMADGSGNAALHLAIKRGNWDMAKYLVSKGADANMADGSGNAALHLAISDGNWDMVRYLANVGADVTKLDGKNTSPVQSAVDRGQWDVVTCLLQNGATITQLSPRQKADLLDRVTRESPDETREFYDVIRLGSSELLDLLMERKLSNAQPDKNDPHALSRAYEELKMKNVALTPEIEFKVEENIINSRFYAVMKDENKRLVKSSLDDVKLRIDLICEQIQNLNKLASGDDDDDVGFDDDFFVSLRFVALNIRVLKRSLKSTYNTLPWEEMEFCLVRFIWSQCKSGDLYSIHNLILDKEKTLKYINCFSLELEKQKDLLDKQNKNISTRNDAIKSVISNNDSFQSMYDDFKMIRNINSLERMLSYVRLALSVNRNEKKALGKLVIERTLQVIGEHLKNTIESPNVSDDVHEKLLWAAPKNLKQIITSVRDSLSHNFSLTNKMELEDRESDQFFENIKYDLEKFGTKIYEILYHKKFHILRTYAEKIANSESFVEMKTRAANLAGIDLALDMESDEICERTQLKRVKLLLEEFRCELQDQTEEEKELFDKLNKMIDLDLTGLEVVKDAFTKGVFNLRCLANIVQYSHRIDGMKGLIRNSIQEQFLFLPPMHVDISTLATELSDKINLRISNEEFPSKAHLFTEFVFQVLYEIPNVRGIDTIKDKLKSTTNVEPHDVANKIDNVVTEVENSLESEEDRKVFREIWAGKKSISETKSKVMDTLKNLKNFSNADDEPVILQECVECLEQFGLKKKKKDFENKFNKKEWDNCYKMIGNVRDSYEILSNSLKTLLKNDKISAVPKPLQDFFEGSTLKKKLKTIDDESNAKQLQNTFERRLETLSQLRSNSGIDFLKACNQDRALKAGVESLVLDLLEILESISLFGDNRLFLDKYSPLLIGKTLRNYLAHGDGLIDALPFDPSIALIATAIKLLKDGKSLVINRKALIGERISDDTSFLRSHYDQTLKTAVSQKGMFKAAVNGSTEEVKRCIAEGADPQARNFEGRTVIHFAAMGDNLDVLSIFLGNNVNIGIRDSKGKSALHTAAMFDATNVTKYFLNQKYLNVDDICNENLTPLLYAARMGHVKSVQVLLDYNANIKHTDKNGNTALHHSAYNGYAGVVKVLIDNNANENVLNKLGYSPLLSAACNNHMDCIDLLIETGINSNIHLNMETIPAPLRDKAFMAIINLQASLKKKTWDTNVLTDIIDTELHLAAKFGQITIVKELLDGGAKPDTPGNKRMTPLHIAAYFDQVEVACLLLAYEANPLALDEDLSTPLHYACANSQKQMVECMLEKKPELEGQNKYHATPFICAVFKNRVDIAVLLLENGADIHAVGREKRGALHEAARHGFTKLAIELLKRGADVNAVDGEKRTPLHHAICNKRKDLVDELLKDIYGTDINAPDERNVTPLLEAVVGESADIVQKLIGRGVVVNYPSCDYEIPLLTAANLGFTDIVKMLLSYGASTKLNTSRGDMNVLHTASNMGHSDIVNLLLNSDICVNCLAYDDYTPLHMACESGELNTVKLLLARGANIKAVTKRCQLTPLLVASLQGQLHVVEYLLTKEADIEARDHEQYTSLLYAAQIGNHNIVKLLLEKGANIDAQSFEGISALHQSVCLDFKDIVGTLLDKGAETNIQDVGGSTPLHYCSQQGHGHFVGGLVKNGAKINIKDTAHKTPLLYAIFKGHKAVVDRLLEHGADVDIADDVDMSPLHHATFREYVDVIGAILEKNPRVDAIDKMGNTALMYAARFGHQSKVLEMLLLKGADADLADDDGCTALHLSTFCQNWENLLTLIEHGANIDATDKKNCTPLFYAVNRGDRKSVEILLEKGANFNICNKDEQSPLDCASMKGDMDIYLMLIKKKVSVEGFGKDIVTELHVAANAGETNYVQSLIARGVDVDSRDLTGWTPLMYASLQGHTRVVQTLIQAGASVKARNEDMDTPLHWAASQGHVDVVNRLLLISQNVDVPNKDKVMPLHVAAYNGHASIVETLLGRGANVNSRQEDGATPLTIASSKGHTAVVNTLLKYSANVHYSDNENYTPLHHATAKGFSDIVRILVEHRADVNAKIQDGSTALHIAASKRHADIVQVLLDNGSNVNAVNDGGYTPLHAAAQRGDVGICNVLLDKGANVDGRITSIGESCSGEAGESGQQEILTPVHLALQGGHKDVAFALLQKEADIVLTIGRVSSLHRAVQCNDIDVMKLLLDRMKSTFSADKLQLSARIDAKDRFGNTSLMWAAELDATEMARLLLEGGADIDARNNSSETVLHRAVVHGSLGCVELLIQCNADVHLEDDSVKTAFELALENISQMTDHTEDYEMIAALLFSVTDLSRREVSGRDEALQD